MAKFQIITTDENGGGSACEALWYEMAEAALRGGHDVEILIGQRSVRHPEIEKLNNFGARVCSRWSEPKAGSAAVVAHKIWSRTCARWSLGLGLDPMAGLRILNVGTMVELAREPWASLMESAAIPTAAIIHNNPEIRCYDGRTERRLRSILQRARAVYFVSNRLLENAEEQLVARIPGARVVRNPVNLSSDHIEPWPAGEGPLRLAVVGRLDAFVKGQIRLLHALSSERWRSRRWELSIFGEGPDRAKIEQAIEFYGLGAHVKFGGFARDVRAEIWRTHHVLVMPSMLEGMPLTLVEAMVCGRPALCSDVGGAAELVRDGENGFLAGSPFARQLDQALERLWQERGRLEEMGLQAHRDATAFLPVAPGEALLGLMLAAMTDDSSTRSR
jgi:glycosyltransferase involved in cell wall biosynthesis